MTSGALCSDHVNYLILRYLQEAGHESAATAFYREWHRTPEYRDPENYPFAPVVRRGELVSVIQDGLHHDELATRVQRKKVSDRRFLFTSVQSREGALERRELLENGVQVGSRPGSSGAKRKGRVQQRELMRAPDEFPTPAPKRQRRSEGSEGVHLNGDAMEVDAASASADADEDAEVASPTVASEPEIIEVPERYDSMDIGVQTDLKAGPKTSTMYWNVENPDATIYHSMWNPNPDAESTQGRTLLVVGESLCRFYEVPENADDARQVHSIGESSIPSNSVVTASAWHPSGHTAALAIDRIHDMTDGRQRSEQTVVSQHRELGTLKEYSIPPLLQIPGIVLALRYSANGDYLLVARTNLKRGWVSVYDTSAESSSCEPIAWRIFEHQILDIVWSAEDNFFVCGDRSIAEAYKLHQTPRNHENGLTSNALSIHRLTRLETIIPTTAAKWDKLCFEPKSQTYAMASTEEHKLVMGHHLTIVTRPFAKFHAEAGIHAKMTAFAFKPSSMNLHPLLLTAFEDGTCTLFSDFFRIEEELNNVLTFHLDDGPALAVAWSPDALYLAVGGQDLVQIWETTALVQKDSIGCWTAREPVRRPIVTWRPEAGTTAGTRNGEEHGEERTLCEPSLSWSADGERLSFAVDRQVAVISFRPPLSRNAIEENYLGDVNGHASP